LQRPLETICDNNMKWSPIQSWLNSASGGECTVKPRRFACLPDSKSSNGFKILPDFRRKVPDWMSPPKVVLFGMVDVGKTALFLRLHDNLFDPNTRSTIQGDCKVIKVERDRQNHEFVLHDTAGQDRFRSLTRAYFRGASVALFVFSLVAEETLNPELVAEIQDGFPDIAFIVVGNKSDLEETRVIERSRGFELAERFNAAYVETSALTGDGIQDLIGEIVQRVAQTPEMVSTVRIGENAPQTRQCC
jgi:small GTP-binding protein